MNCTSVYTTHINGTHTRTLYFIYINSCTDILYFCKQLAHMDTTYTHMWHRHYDWINCTDALAFSMAMTEECDTH